MTIQQTYLSFTFRLNKLGSNANQKVDYTQFINLMNKAQLHWAEERIKIAERDTIRVDEVQQLIRENEIAMTRIGDVWYGDVPADYFHFKRSHSVSTKCGDFVNNIFVEEGNLNTLLVDENSKPSMEWGETLLTITGNKIKIHADFDLKKTYLVYYRLPRLMDIKGYETLTGPSVTIDPEWTGTNMEEIIDLAVQIATGDINDPQRYETITRHKQEYN